MDVIYGAWIVVGLVFGLLAVLLFRFWLDRRDFAIRNESEFYRTLDDSLRELLSHCFQGRDIKREYRITHHCSSIEEFEAFDAAACWQAYVASHHEFLSYLLDCLNQNQERQSEMYRVGNRILPEVEHHREYVLCHRRLIELAQSVVCDVLFTLEWQFGDRKSVAIYMKRNLQEQLDLYERSRLICSK